MKADRVKIKNILKYLRDKGYICSENELNSAFEGYNKSIVIDLNLQEYDIQLNCTFPTGFPYAFPEIHLHGTDIEKIKPIPHVNADNSICIYDKEIAYPNPQKPKEIVLESFEKAIRIIKKGINKENMEEYKKEFKAYWEIYNNWNNQYKTLGLFSIPKESTTLFYIMLKNNKIYITDNRENLIKWLKIKNNLSYKLEHFKKCLFLPLGYIGNPPLPENNIDIYKLIEKNGYTKIFNTYIKNNYKKPIIIFSQIINEQYLIGGWMHHSLKAPNGWRKGKIPSKYVMKGTQKNDQINRFIVNLLNKNRIFFRGGDGIQTPNLKLSITGCGSVGSYLIDSLTKLGLDDFILIDKDIITSENIARHICGSSYIYKSKVNAIYEKLIKHYPYINCKRYNDDIFKILEENLNIFNNCDFNFIVVGYRPIEDKFNNLFLNHIITKPLIFMWVEPFAYGGHAVILQEPNYNSFNNLFDVNNNRFKNRILRNVEGFSKREAGCQSTFIPYSSFEVQKFINSFLDFFNNNFIQQKLNGNYLFSWGGKLSFARKEHELNSKWLSKEDNSKTIVRIK